MSNTQYTPGPWFADNQKVCAESNSVLIANCAVRYSPHVECGANAKLISAAPDMAKALKHILEDALAMGMASSAFSGAVIEARAALAKAGVQS